ELGRRYPGPERGGVVLPGDPGVVEAIKDGAIGRIGGEGGNGVVDHADRRCGDQVAPVREGRSENRGEVAVGDWELARDRVVERLGGLLPVAHRAGAAARLD